LLTLLAFALVYFALARFGMAVFALQPSNITLLWLPSGIALVMCLEWGWRAVPFIVTASFIANLDGMATNSVVETTLHTAIAAATDGLAGMMAAFLFRRRLPAGLTRTADLFPFMVWVCLLPTLTSGTLLAVNLALGHYIAWDHVGAMLRMLVLADSLGLLLIYPIYQGWQARHSAPPEQSLALLVSTLAIAGLLAASTSDVPGMEFFIVPIMLFLSFNVGLLVLSSTAAIVLIILFAATAHEAGPLVTHGDSAFRLVAFAFSTALTILGVALQRSQLERTERTRALWQDAAEHDPLTALLNRRAFLPKVHAEHQRALRSEKPYAVAMLDLDHFKVVNDSFGHAGGDLVLVAFAKALQENCRLIDTVARVGGEEFAILLPECSAEQARPMLDRLRNKIAELRVPVDTAEVTVTVSIGAASCHCIDEAPEMVVMRADQALYRAKQSGRNCVIIDSTSPAYGNA
jgi:diguanylate cyclase (GGDEF)-like protein